MIIVRHLTGPRAGSEDRLDPKLDRIVFGRRMSCEVVFPPEETLVAREHFALERKPPGAAGHWIVELFGEPFVAVNGLPADPGQRLPPDATFELGKRGGPSFSVHLEADAEQDNLPLTDVQEEDEGAHAAAAKAEAEAEHAESRAGLARRIAVAGLAVAILAGAAAGYFYWTRKPSGISAAVRAHLLGAAFLVEAPVGQPEATAFPIAPHRLATNAHVGQLFLDLRPGQHMIVRAPGKDGKAYTVVGAELHPGYKAYSAFLQSDVIRQKFFDLAIAGYDVAVLRVRKKLPQGAILKLATAKELRALKPGTQIATAGYPLERVSGSNAQAFGATPELHIGTIEGMTNFFFLPDRFARDQLIHHDLPTTGGQSGSPIVDRSGRVIALDSAASFYFTGANQRIPSGVLINYAQRVDLLEQLVSGNAGREIAADRKYWAKEFSVFSSGIDIVEKIIFSKVEDAEKTSTLNATRISEAIGALSERTRIGKPGGGFQRQIRIPVKVAAGADYLFIAYAHDGSALQLWAYDGSTILAHVPTMGRTFAPWLRFKPAKSGTLSLWLVHPKDADATYSFDAFRLAAKPPPKEAQR